MTTKTKLINALLLSSLATLWGCYPGGPEYVDELDIVYTTFDEEFPFSAKSTYKMPDDIRILSGDPDEDPTFIDPIFAQPMLQRIENNMTARGFTRVEQGEEADMELLPASWSTTTILVSGGYWGGYWCYWDPYYCGGGWYYPYPVYSSYTTGTLVMVIADPQNPATDGSRGLVWTAAINGLLTGSYDANRVLSAIDQAFKQSPYLSSN